MEIKNWLSNGGVLGIDLGGDLNLLSAIALLDKELDANESDTDLEDVIQALDALAFDEPEAAKVREILNKNGLDADALAAVYPLVWGPAPMSS